MNQSDNTHFPTVLWISVLVIRLGNVGRNVERNECAAVCGSVLQCVAACCSVVQCGAVC